MKQLSPFLEKIYQSHQTPKSLPGVEEVEQFLSNLLKFIFPELNAQRLTSRLAVETQFNFLKLEFEGLLYKTEACDKAGVKSVCQCFFKDLENVYELAVEDSRAILMGDPAAIDTREVIRSYPGFHAIAIYRIAHSLLSFDVPYLPRIFTEIAHSKTGIDIHPGANIGRRFCIDHGTGVVIGETTDIGNDVKIYQGVTLGALSVSKDLAQQKRHPTIEDNVVIYAEATILGGQTTIGANSIIGGNVWLTKSVPPHSKVYYSAKGKMKQRVAT